MNFNFDYYHNLERVNIYLCNPDGRELFPLVAKNRNIRLRFNDLSEVSFDSYQKATDASGDTVVFEAYEFIQTKRLLFVENIGWFQISEVEEKDDGVEKFKTITAESYQSVFKHRGFASEERVYCLYHKNNPTDVGYDPKDKSAIPSVVGQLHSQLGVQIDISENLAPIETMYDEWTVTYVNPNLIFEDGSGVCRTFNEGIVYAYDWIVNDVEEAFEAVVLFDFLHKSIQFLSPEEATKKSSVVYTFRNFMNGIDISESADDIVTVLNCSGDNCNISGVNPTGTNYICDFGYFMDETSHRWMSTELINKIKEWKLACESRQEEYTSNISMLRDLYKERTERKTELQKLSVVLQDLKTAISKNSSLGEYDKPRAMSGINIVETVSVGEISLEEGLVFYGESAPKSETISRYYQTPFSENTVIRAYNVSPTYNAFSTFPFWSFPSDAQYLELTVSDLVNYNFDEQNQIKLPYVYFFDMDVPTSYCKIKSSVSSIDKDSGVVTYKCDGFDRYVASTYPDNGKFYDFTQHWVELLEKRVALVNAEISGKKYITKTESVLFSISSSQPRPENREARTQIVPFSTPHDEICRVYVAGAIDLDDGNACESLGIDNVVRANLTEDGEIQISALLYPDEGLSVSVGIQYYVKPQTLMAATSLDEKIYLLNEAIDGISSQLNILSFFSSYPALLKELSCYWFEGDYVNEHIAVSDETTPEKRVELELELKNAGQTQLSKVSKPKFSFSVSSSYAITSFEFRDQLRDIELGRIVSVEKSDGVWYSPILLEMSINLDSKEDFSLSFSNGIKLNSWEYSYADLISDSASTSRQVSANWRNLLEYSREKTEIDSLLRDPLDATKRAAFSNLVNQDFVVNSNGIWGRKRKQQGLDEFEKEQLRIINNVILFTDDDWDTAKSALGKIYYTDENGTQTSSYGLIAETIIGDLIVGEKLKIKNGANTISIGNEGILIQKRVLNEDGTTYRFINTFEADSDGNVVLAGCIAAGSSIEISDVFRVDPTGRLVAKSGEIAGINFNDIGLFWEEEGDGTIGFGLWKNGSVAGNVVMHVGGNRMTAHEAPFRVLADGTLYATRANIDGVLTAKKGSSIGNFSITDDGDLLLETDDSNNRANFLTVKRTVSAEGVDRITTVSTGAIQLLSVQTGQNVASAKKYITLDVDQGVVFNATNGYSRIYQNTGKLVLYTATGSGDAIYFDTGSIRVRDADSTSGYRSCYTDTFEVENPNSIVHPLKIKVVNGLIVSVTEG